MRSTLADRYAALKERLAFRADSTKTASYRVRWRAQGVEPHAELILHIDYGAPARFHIVGKGPLDVPVFTMWVVDSQFVLLDHEQGRTRRGKLGEFWTDDVSANMPSLDMFLGLLSGGCGIRLPDSINADGQFVHGTSLSEITLYDGSGQLLVADLQRGCVKRLAWSDDGGRIEGEVRFGEFTEEYPFWQPRAGYWNEPGSQGVYRWEVLARKFNHELPERVFTPPAER